MPVRWLNSSAAKCAAEPLPADEKVSVPGWALPRAMRSATELIPLCGETISTRGLTAVRTTGAKSFDGS